MVLRQALMGFFSKQIHNDGEVQSSDSDRPSSVEDMGESGQVEADLEALCAANGLNPDDDLYDIGDLSVSDLSVGDFMQKVFNTWDNDPSDFPGSNHASAYLSGQDITYGRPYQNLTEDDQYHICELLTENYAKERMVGQFEIGKVVGDRFTITVQFSEAEGSFNRGIYLVEGMSNQGKGILKLLPTGAMNPGYAEREISILARLNHRNIIKLYHCHLPTYPHDTPWLIADYCNKLILKDYVRANALSGHVIPELFAWQIFTSLVEAVAYCHNGDLSSSDWTRSHIGTSSWATSSSRQRSTKLAPITSSPSQSSWVIGAAVFLNLNGSTGSWTWTNYQWLIPSTIHPKRPTLRSQQTYVKLDLSCGVHSVSGSHPTRIR
jgi:hypothetical protein